MSDEKTRVQIPTDAQVVRDFIAESPAFDANPLKSSEAEYWRQTGNREAREALAARLGYVKVQRAELVREAADKLAAAFADAGRKISGALTAAYAKAEAKTDQGQL